LKNGIFLEDDKTPNPDSAVIASPEIKPKRKGEITILNKFC
jgi:hypothetical protein